MGGLAVPSLAVTKTDIGLDNFGKVSLIGHSDMVDSTKDSKAKTFNSDIYSPRYPNVSYEVNLAKYKEVLDELNAIVLAKYDAPAIYLDDIEERGVGAFLNKPLHFLEDTGRGFKPLKKVTTLPKEFHAFVGEPWHELKVDDKFIKAVDLYLSQKKFGGHLGKTKEGFDNLVNNYALETSRVTSLKPVVDYTANKHKAEDKVRKSKKLTQEMKEWAQDKADSVISNERIFNGWTYSGNKKFVQHSLNNVIKLMKKDLRGGENFFSGVGTLRSQVAKQFKSVAQIKKNRDSVISTEDIAELKEEVGSTYYDLIQALKPYSAFTLDGNPLIASDVVAEGLHEFAKTGSWESFKDVPESLKQEVNEFLTKLADAPTEYFEAKIQRAVGLDEFVYAVMPKDTSKQAKKVARKNGLTVRLYDENIEGDKQRVISGLKKVLFQDKRGSIQFSANIGFRSTQTIISLFENSDRSTFLHESGHFFLQVMQDLAEDTNPPKAIAEDWKIILKYLGVEKGADIGVEEHEKWARGFEKYLFEGNAPSIELQDAFSRFKMWLVSVYKQAVNLDVEIRRVRSYPCNQGRDQSC